MEVKEVGLSPGSLVYTGAMKHQVDGILFRYSPESFEEVPFDSALPSLEEAAGCSWLIVHGVHDVEKVKTIGDRFDIHPLVLEDLVNPTQRMKIEEYENYIFVVLKWYVEVDEDEWETEQLSILLLDNWVVLFLEERSDLLEPVIRRLHKKKSTLRNSGPDYLTYALIDLVVDHYMRTADQLSDRIEAVEDGLMEDETEPLDELKLLQHQAQALKRNLRAMKELNNNLVKADVALIREGTRIYLRDVYDHTLQCLDQVDSMQESITSALNFYHSIISMRLNEVMKFLTMMGSVFIPLTFIAGIYGMNFQDMPELRWAYGYPAALLSMLLVSLGILYYFKRKKWL